MFTKEKRSVIMSRITSKNTQIELGVFRFLRQNKIYFQKHYSHAPGKPDIAIPRKKIAVLIDGDFWHGWKFKEQKHKLGPYWQTKIENNMRRDKKNIRLLKKNGWRIMRVWEHDLVPRKREATYKRVLQFISAS